MPRQVKILISNIQNAEIFENTGKQKENIWKKALISN